MSFRLVPKSVILNDLEQRNGLTLPYLTFGVGGYRPPSAEAITGLAQCTSPK